MSKKSYFLGLGIGITVTALILGISFQSRNTVMTDEEIITRAKELGMIENTVISELEQKDSTLTQQTNPSDEVKTPDEASLAVSSPVEASPAVSSPVEATPAVTNPVEATPAVTSPVDSNPEVTNPDIVSPAVTGLTGETDSTDNMTDNKETINSTTGETTQVITITINPGESSVSVSKKLAEAGLVEDATSYDVYLCNNGYDKRITVGSHPIPTGSSLEEIAKLISSKQ